MGVVPAAWSGWLGAGLKLVQALPTPAQLQTAYGMYRGVDPDDIHAGDANRVMHQVFDEPWRMERRSRYNTAMAGLRLHHRIHWTLMQPDELAVLIATLAPFRYALNVFPGMESRQSRLARTFERVASDCRVLYGVDVDHLDQNLYHTRAHAIWLRWSAMRTAHGDECEKAAHKMVADMLVQWPSMGEEQRDTVFATGYRQVLKRWRAEGPEWVSRVSVKGVATAYKDDPYGVLTALSAAYPDVDFQASKDVPGPADMSSMVEAVRDAGLSMTTMQPPKPGFDARAAELANTPALERVTCRLQPGWVGSFVYGFERGQASNAVIRVGV